MNLKQFRMPIILLNEKHCSPKVDTVYVLQRHVTNTP